MSLLQSDMGGMIYQPTVSLHRDVSGIDFVSMYPDMMVKYNSFSPSTSICCWVTKAYNPYK
jgi:DNA polymerase elongation subunit (family B)